MKLEWAEKQQRSFEELKNRLVTAPILALPMPGVEYTIHSDASKFGLGCVLMLEGHVIAFRQL
jgi:RNase H-like domain found in reverse transcriptase